MQQIVMPVRPNDIHMAGVKHQIPGIRLPVGSHHIVAALRQFHRSSLRLLNVELLIAFVAFFSVVPDSLVIQLVVSHPFQIAPCEQNGSARQYIPNIRSVAVSKHRLAAVRLHQG
ncbi:hypothetical protein D3C76_1534000 [compost metagenome]